MLTVSTVTSKGQVVIPKTYRDIFDIKPFDRVYFSVINDRIVLEPVNSVVEMLGFLKTNKKYSQKEINKAIEQGVLADYNDNY